MRLVLPLSIALIVGATAALAGPFDVELERLNRWLWPPKVMGPPAPPPPPPAPPAPVVAPPPREALPPLVRPRPITVPERPKAKPKRREVVGLPPCSVVRREYQRMTYAQQIAAYMAATPEQVAHGRRCLGL